MFSYDRYRERFTDLGPIFDSLRGESCSTTHWLCEIEPGRFYVGETDNLARTGYLWECRLD
jgi:hypothetical protein